MSLCPALWFSMRGSRWNRIRRACPPGPPSCTLALILFPQSTILGPSKTVIPWSMVQRGTKVWW
ncbi:MAG: hypothetical protein HY721_06725 [Planctomycetes bacterium]|nr:hypothetical protein [Planctomycetota bacterium]